MKELVSSIFTQGHSRNEKSLFTQDLNLLILPTRPTRKSWMQGRGSMRSAHKHILEASCCSFSALHGTIEIFTEPKTGDKLPGSGIAVLQSCTLKHLIQSEQRS